MIPIMRHGVRTARSISPLRHVFAPRVPAVMRLQARAFTPTRVSPQGAMAHVFSKPLVDFLLIISRVARITLGSVLAVAATAFGLWEGTHQYVEFVAMRSAATEATGVDDEFGWASQTALDLLGTSGSGTDARLGTFGRHLVRSAWIAENWGGGVTPSALFDKGSTEQTSNHGLVLAESFLSSALSVADARKLSVPESIDIDHDTKLDATAVLLEAWHAAVCERLATRPALMRAVSLYEKLYDATSKTDVPAQAAAFATHLGTVYALLGNKSASDRWLERATTAVGGQSINNTLREKNLTGGPLASRSQITTLEAVSRIRAVSASTRADLQSAIDAAISTARLAHGQGSVSGGPSAQLHALWMQQEQALLSIYIGETLYALQRKKPSLKEQLLTFSRPPTPASIGGKSSGSKGDALSMEWLEHARDTAENVTAALGEYTTSDNPLRIPSMHILLRTNSIKDEAQRLLDILK